MTTKQKLFCDDYISTLGKNATESARRVGYSVKSSANAPRWIKANVLGNTSPHFKPALYEYIQKGLIPVLEDLENKSVATRDELLRYLTKGVRGELEEEVVVVTLDGNGNSSPKRITKKISLKNSIECARVLAKYYGLDNVKISGSTNISITINDDL